MKNTTIRLISAVAFGVAIAATPQAHAQSTLGGAKPQQNKIGGGAKPAPVVGGATVHAYTPPPPKPGPVVNIAKPGTPPATPGSMGTSRLSGQAAGASAPHPPVTPPGKGNTVVSSSSNLKCSGGACSQRGPKP